MPVKVLSPGPPLSCAGPGTPSPTGWCVLPSKYWRHRPSHGSGWWQEVTILPSLSVGGCKMPSLNHPPYLHLVRRWAAICCQGEQTGLLVAPWTPVECTQCPTGYSIPLCGGPTTLHLARRYNTEYNTHYQLLCTSIGINTTDNEARAKNWNSDNCKPLHTQFVTMQVTHTFTVIMQVTAHISHHFHN